MKNFFENDQQFVYYETLIKMFEIFRKRFTKKYVKKKT